MQNHFTDLRVWIAAAVAALTAVWGWFGWLVVAWACLMLADWLVGSAAAARRGEWSSKKLREGAWHKGGMIVIVCVACAADWLLGAMLKNLPGVTLPFVSYGGSSILGTFILFGIIQGLYILKRNDEEEMEMEEEA